MADHLTEQGEEEYLAHLEGACEDFCRYCVAVRVKVERPGKGRKKLRPKGSKKKPPRNI